MQIRRIRISNFRVIKFIELFPGSVTVLLGPSNAGKSAVLAGLDLLLHRGVGRPRALSELDFYGRDPAKGLEIEAVLGELPGDLTAEVVDHLEGWNADARQVVAEPDGPGIETVLRVRVTADSTEVVHSFAKPESAGARFPARVRARLGWVYEGRGADPAREFAFYQGSVLDRLFTDADLDGPVEALRQAVAGGAKDVNENPAINPLLVQLGTDLRDLGLLVGDQRPSFEVGAVSRRELLQALRLALPANHSTGPVAKPQTGNGNGKMDRDEPGAGGDADAEEVTSRQIEGPKQDPPAPPLLIPVERQGRGAQRLLLVTAMLRLARATHASLIAAFDEPEQALEPLRQTQLIDLLGELTDSGGQLFLATHSPDIVRGFPLDALVHMPGPGSVLALASVPFQAKQHYERKLDGAVVRGLFAPVPLLVEGPSDRPVLQTFWHALAKTGDIPPMAHLGIDIVNCEGADLQRPMAALLDEIGKPVVVWAEQDVPDKLAALRAEKRFSALLLHDPRPSHWNLERSLAQGAGLVALIAAMQTLADDRGIDWSGQRMDLISRLPPDVEGRENAKGATTLTDFLTALPDEDQRALIASALAPKGNGGPFDMKGARQGRLVAEMIVVVDGGPPASYRQGLHALAEWIKTGCPRSEELKMAVATVGPAIRSARGAAPDAPTGQGS